MDVTPHELRDCQITDAFRGYNRDEVNELMERAAATIETQAEKIRILTERVSSVTTDATRTRDNEDIIQRTLILAQRAADEALADATRQAAEILSDAESRSRSMVDAANGEVRRVHDVERARLDAEIRDLSTRRDALHADVAALESWEREYRGRVISQLEADLATARAKRAIAPPDPPSPPAEPEGDAVAMAEPVGDTEAEVSNADANGTAPVAAAARRGPKATTTEPDIDLTTDVVHAAEPAPEPAEVVEAVPVAAGGVAVPKPSRPIVESTAPLAGSAREAKTARNEGVQAVPDARLDDDAFFATLRDAVRDDAPLGPADDRLFDNERESGIGNIFKRRKQ